MAHPEDFGPERGEAARDYLRRRMTRRYFTTGHQWHAVQQVLDTAAHDVPLDELQQTVCRARLTTYRVRDHA